MAVDQTLGIWREGFRQMHAVTRAARAAGLSQAEIVQALERGGVPDKYIGAIVAERIPPWQPSRQAIKEAVRSVAENSAMDAQEMMRRRRWIYQMLRALRK